MATDVMAGTVGFERGRPRRTRGWARPLSWGLALGLVVLLSGDRAGLGAGAVQGIDPLDILNLQVKPNVVFVLDSSLEMGLTPEGTHYVGGDDPKSRFYMAKQALREVVAANQGVMNMGLIDMSASQGDLQLGDPVPGRHQGPFTYVTDDPNAKEWIGYFDKLGDTPPEYDLSNCPGGSFAGSACSEQVFRSIDTTNFNGFGSNYAGRFYVVSRLFWNNAHIFWNVNNSPNKENDLRDVTRFDCASRPPASGLLGDDTDEFNDGSEFRPCFVLEDSTGTRPPVTFYLTSLTYTSAGDPDGECDGSTARCLLEGAPACTAPSNAAAIQARLRLQDPFEASGLPRGLDDGVPAVCCAAQEWRGRQPNAAGGAQLGPATRPLDLALRAAQAHYASTIFPSRPGAVSGLQKNFVIVVTSGPDTTLIGNPVVRAAAMRGTSNPGILTGTGSNDITTLVVTINGDPSFDGTQVNALQAAGTNGSHTTAFGAATADELKESLNFAVSQTIATGTFSTESSITESVYEWSALAGPYSPFDPNTRYRGRVPTLLQSSFDMPGFVGHLRAFINANYDGKGPNVPKWDAGAELRARIWNGPDGSSGLCAGNIALGVDGLEGTPDDVANYNRCIYGPDGLSGTADDSAVNWTFDQLTGGPPSGTNVGQIPSFKPGSSAAGVIQRRIFTTRSHGVFPYDISSFGENFGVAGNQCPVPLWPPTTSSSVGSCSYSAPVAPANDSTAGLLDAELGIASLSLADLQSRFGACLSAPPGHACLDSDPAVATGRARREAREIILAFTAGAQVSTVNGLPRRNSSGDLLYVARFWPLAESTLAVPAVVPPPLEARPQSHTAEYLVFRDGLATDPAGPTAGFGLRNPDKAAASPQTNNYPLEPLMSVVYHAANDMLHAFRAGPCHNSSTLGSAPTGVCVGGTVEKGGEELWGFVPYDQLGNLAERMQGQGRARHTYMVASSLRFSDVFVPGTFLDTNTGRTFLGQWRTILVFGRGIAGQHYTAIDITSPGQFVRASLDTQAPFAIWSRGNPDTQNGLAGGSLNSLLDRDGGDEGADDEAAYAKMGETWSVPALAAVPPSHFFEKEFALFMGSGYSPNGSPTQGKTFYALDALTGDVLHAVDVPDTGKACTSVQSGETCPVPNAIVANPAAYVAVQLAKGFVGNPSASTASLVYVGDLHGRMWKFITNSPSVGLTKIQPDSGAFADSPDQPIGNATALLNIDNTPHVYWETGNDLRVLHPPNFRLVAMRDVGADANASRAADGLFRFDLENAFAGYRGTAQPATAFNAEGKGRAFFVGTKFTDQNVPGGTCRSRFDSVIFAVAAVSGDAVYDFDNSGSYEREIGLAGTKVNAIRAALGQIVLDQGDIGNKPPAPPPAPAAAPTANEGSSGEVRMVRLKAGSAVCRN